MRACWLNTSGYPDLSAEDLRAQGVTYEHVPREKHREFLDQVKVDRGYVAEDTVTLTAKTTDLATLLAKFDREHSHSDDEVRYVLEGSGVFDIRSQDDRWMRVAVEAGDFIIVPKGRHHLFFMDSGRNIKAIRLFRDQAGWVPTYR